MHRPSPGDMCGPPMDLRDRLAVDRTQLANERTLLSYTRTGLGVAVVGGSLIQFFHTLTAALTGLVFLAAGVVTIAVGWARFLTVRRHLRALHRRDLEAARDERGP
ncbi:MAG: DUF202 domain-containing protein, partial [Planctomycetota bacterium]